MYSCDKRSLISLAFLVILPLAAMQPDDLPEWRKEKRTKPAINSPLFARASRRRSFSTDDGRLSPDEKKAQEALMQDPKAIKILSKSMQEMSRHTYTKQELSALKGSADKCSPEVMQAVLKFKKQVLSKSQ